MELIPEQRNFRTHDFRPKIEDQNYVSMNFTLPSHLVCFGDQYEELAHRVVPEEERRLLGLMLRITRHNGYRIKKLVLDELFKGMNEWGLLDDKDAEELLSFVEDGIREYHVHGPFDEKTWAEYLATKASNTYKVKTQDEVTV
jgi:hypothetical protein